LHVVESQIFFSIHTADISQFDSSAIQAATKGDLEHN